MYRFTKKTKKIMLTFIFASIIICMILVMNFSWVSGITGHTFTNNYYTVYINGKKAGNSLNHKSIQKAIKEARRRINDESTSLQFVDADIDIKKSKKVFGKTDSVSELSSSIYDAFESSVKDTKQKAYVVDIDGYIITLNSLADVEYLFNAVKNKYDDSEDFSTNLHLDDIGGHTTITCSISKAGISSVNFPTVMASGDGSDDELVENSSGNGTDTISGIDDSKDVKFGEKVEIIPCYVEPSQINELNSAINMVSADDKSAELSVVVTENQTYDVEYSVPVEYVYNDNLYNTKQNVLNEGSAGVKTIVANVTYKNGKETNRDILQETITKQAEARVIEVGTAVPPTFIKPINGGTLSSTFGARWGTVHKGVDWACSIGTAVMASCNGTVIQAGWMNGYGYCVTLKHSDGKCTRYGHLSEVLVSEGQSVSQSDVIALSGNTGNSTGPHVHFEIIEDGVQVNPFTYLN